MPWYEVESSHNLTGELYVQGSKNAALPILAATLLTREVTIINGCPDISDIHRVVNILKSLGCKVFVEKNIEGLSITVDASTLTGFETDMDNTGKLRASIVFLGALLAATGNARMTYPGGCHIGKRPIDMHIEALEDMGATIIQEDGRIKASADILYGNTIKLKKKSVGTTENVILAAVLAKGNTIIYNAACEPEVIELIRVLNKMGARIKGAGKNIIKIQGVKKLRGCTHHLSGDRIVTATYLSAVCICTGTVCLKNVYTPWCTSTVNIMRRAGADISLNKNEILITMNRKNTKFIKNVTTSPYPGIATDIQPFITAMMCFSDGVSTIKETVFENRFLSAKELIKKGADISLVDNCIAVVKGRERLNSGDVYGKDLRGGASLIISAMRSEGTTRVFGNEYIERGYENIAGDLSEIGGRIKMVYEKKDNNYSSDNNNTNYRLCTQL